MADTSRGLIFRKRNVLGAALVAGIGLGIYFGQFKGLGLGGNGSQGNGLSSQESQAIVGDEGSVKHLRNPSDDTTTIPNVVRVVVDDRQYLLRGESKDTPIELAALIDLVKKAPGDEDGVRVRVYEQLNARMSVVEDLKTKFSDAGIADTAVLWFQSAPGK